MKVNAKIQKNSQQKGSLNLLLVIIALIVLFYSNSTFDPINTPKQIILYLGAAWLCGFFILKNQRKLRVQLFKINFRLEIVLLIFLLFQLVSALVSEDKLTGIFGENQRKNGFLTYLALSIVFIYTARFFTQLIYDKFVLFIILLSFLLASYGILQFTGNDFQDWSNLYNPVILTVGNPNFASALLAIFGVLLFSFLFIKQYKLVTKLLSGTVLTMVGIVIYKSDSIQGLVVLVLGSSLVAGCVLLISPSTKRFSFVFFSALTGFSILAVMGMLQMGPLQTILYKGSVSVRGYYWRAAWKMFTENPILGIGTDQYGSYFRVYRDPGYALNYGFEITSSNAHNVYLQFLSTGGIVVGMSYLLFILLIFKSSLAYLLNSTIGNDEKLKFVGLFFAWVSYLIQGVVSIDNISLAIWGWFLGGVVYAWSYQNSGDLAPIKAENARIIFSGLVTLPVIIVCTFLARAEVDMLNQARVASFENTIENRAYFKSLIFKITSNPLSDQRYKRLVGERLADANEDEESIKIFDSLILKHPSTPENYYSRIIVNSKLGKLTLVMRDQEQLLKLDPYNAKNMLALGENYKKLKEYEKMQHLQNQILEFAGGTEVAKLAKEKLVAP